MERVGIIPAAGFASRLSELPCSKEIFPVGFHCEQEKSAPRPRAACQSLLESMAFAGVKNAYVILRSGKWDIPAYLGSGSAVGLNLAYLVTKETPGVPFTVDRAFPFVEKALMVFGFADIIFGPRDAFVRLLDRQEVSGADVVLGLYRANQPDRSDMVALDSANRVRNIQIKPRSTTLEYAWIIAVWTAVFTQFMHTFILRGAAIPGGERKELYMGDVLRAWVQKGFPLETVTFADERYVDIGTPEDLASVLREWS